METPAEGGRNRCNEPKMAKNRRVCIPTNKLVTKYSKQDCTRQNIKNSSSDTDLANTKLVWENPTAMFGRSNNNTKVPAGDHKCQWGKSSTAEIQNISASRMDFIRSSYRNMGFSKEASKYMSEIHRGTTIKSYDSTWGRWVSWCQGRQVNPFSPAIQSVVEFLLQLYKEGLEVSSIAQYRSALSATLPPIGGYKIGSNPILNALLKGFIYERPKQYKQVKNWSVDAVLDTIDRWMENWNLTPQRLTWKLATLLALTASNRVSELVSLKTNNITKLPDGIAFKLDKHKKNRKSNTLPGMVFYPTNPDNKNLCPCTCLDVYLERTHMVRSEGDEVVFRSYIRPYRSVKTTSLSRWITKTIAEAGFDIKPQQYVAHSARGKSASKAHLQGIALQDIMKAAEWKAESTYSKHYYSPDFNSAYGRAILKSALNK